MVAILASMTPHWRAPSPARRCGVLLHRSLIGIVFAASLSGSPGPALADDEGQSGTLTVRVQGMASSDGTLRFTLFASKKDFLKRPSRAGVVAIENRQGVWVVENLAFGTYAVLVHHDVDSSGVMERHWYGKPKEPTGSSNDAPARFGPPRFKDAKFQFETSTKTITIPLR